MANESYEGICSFCNEVITKKTHVKHFIKCTEKLKFESQFEAKQPHKYYQILVEAKYEPVYWMLIEASSILTLNKVDSFLRDIWLECCGHLSEFSVQRNKIDMNRKLYDVLQPKLVIDYEYDFGTSTDIKLKVLEVIESKYDKAIRILAMNTKPEIICSACEIKPAAYMCDICSEEILCEDCIKKHHCLIEEGEELCSPLVNSPRSNVCGYSGQNLDSIKRFFPKQIPNIF